MSETSTLIGYSGRTIGREELALVPTPAATETHRPVPHHEIVQASGRDAWVSPHRRRPRRVRSLARRHESLWGSRPRNRDGRVPLLHRFAELPRQEHAFGDDLWVSRVRVLEHGVRRGFYPVLAKHSKSFSLIDCISVGVDRMQRNFEPMRKQVEAWQRSELTDVTAKVVIYEAFVEGRLEAPKHLARTVHDLYFEPKYEEFQPRTIWSLSNAFTSAFKELDPVPQFKATAKLGEFLEARFSQSF